MGPETGLIVRREDGRWLDELGRDWTDGIRYELPDLDVFALDTAASEPAELRAWSGAGTVLFAMDVDHRTGDLWVAGTEAFNEVRFSGRGLFGGPTVRGHLHDAQLTRLTEGETEPFPLNPHLTHALWPTPEPEAARSTSQPVATDLHDGIAWVADYGNSRVTRVDLDALAAGTWSPDAGQSHPVTGGGPAGVLVDATRGLVFVYTRFDNGVSALDLVTGEERWHVVLPTPEPIDLQRGRAAFHDAGIGSSNRASSCGSCHVFGHTDGLAWDLGDPDGRVETNPNPVTTGDPSMASFDFHPLKGPMTTQTLRGIADAGALHWRGDRTGGLTAGSGPADAFTAFLDFEEAFDSLMGANALPGAAVMQDMATWATAIEPPPNPYLPLDGVRNAEQELGWQISAGATASSATSWTRPLDTGAPTVRSRQTTTRGSS